MAEERDERDMQEHIIRTEGQTEERDRFGELRTIAAQRELSTAEHKEFIELYNAMIRSTAQHFTPEKLASEHERRSNETYDREPEFRIYRLEVLVDRFRQHEERWQGIEEKITALDKRFAEYEQRLERYEARERDREREQGWERSR